MKFQVRRRDDLDLNITPLIDVVFLLLIFFMVSTTFNENSRLQINLPSSSVEDPPQLEEDTIRVAVDVDSVIYVQDRKLPDSRLATVEEAIRRAGLDMETPHLIINADADARHQSVITIMDAARRLDLTQIGLNSRWLEEESP